MSRGNGEKRLVILEAALELFAEHGFHGAPTALIARRAGVGVGTIYRYFRDKDELIRELHRDLRCRAVAVICDGYREEMPVREGFHFLLTGLLRFFIAEPRIFKFMEQYYYSPFPQTRSSMSPDDDEVIRRLLLVAREKGIIKEAPLPVLEALAFGPVIALAKEQINRRLVCDEETMRQVVEGCWQGLVRQS